MPQFTPTTQERMLDLTERKDWVLQATKCGDGLRVVEDNSCHDDVVFGGLTRNHGWYYDCTLWTSEATNKVHILMPITEVGYE